MCSWNPCLTKVALNILTTDMSTFGCMLCRNKIKFNYLSLPAADWLPNNVTDAVLWRDDVDGRLPSKTAGIVGYGIMLLCTCCGMAAAISIRSSALTTVLKWCAVLTLTWWGLSIPQSSGSIICTFLIGCKERKDADDVKGAICWVLTMLFKRNAIKVIIYLDKV